jgi:hypothetical protein
VAKHVKVVGEHEVQIQRVFERLNQAQGRVLWWLPGWIFIQMVRASIARCSAPMPANGSAGAAGAGSVSGCRTTKWQRSSSTWRRRWE